MSRAFQFLFVFVLLIGSRMAISGSKAAEPAGVAVVELFTSQGCSSCPPADRVLAKLVAEQAKSNDPVYCLTFPVDYWDRLGWKDPFADKRFTQRQTDYAETLNLDSVYTPQMVVNGQFEFVGSKASTAAQAIAAALKTPSQVQLKLKTTLLKDRQLQVHYDLSGKAENTVLHVALVQSGLETSVKRGENAGSTLKHSNVVRAFESVDIESATSGDATVKIPENIDLAQTRIIAFVQNPETKRVLGANQTETFEAMKLSLR